MQPADTGPQRYVFVTSGDCDFVSVLLPRTVTDLMGHSHAGTEFPSSRHSMGAAAARVRADVDSRGPTGNAKRRRIEPTNGLAGLDERQ